MSDKVSAPEHAPTKPRPVSDTTSAGYWEATARGEFALPQCSECLQYAMPPTTVCHECGSSDPRYTYVQIDGAGSVRSWTIVRDAFLPGFADDLPYLLVDVELDVQPQLRMIGRLVDGIDAPLAIADRVTMVFDAIAEGVAVPCFTLEAP